jgi:transcriptional regulator with XRE-family HTH domain
MRSSPKQKKQQAKTPPEVMSEDRKSELVAQFTDDVLSKLTGAFFDVSTIEHWTKRDLSQIIGMNETAVGHILAGRRKNLTIETIALLARAMKVRPELVMHDMRPAGNHIPSAEPQNDGTHTLAAQFAPYLSVRALPSQRTSQSSTLQKVPTSAESLAYAQPEFEEEASR